MCYHVTLVHPDIHSASRTILQTLGKARSKEQELESTFRQSLTISTQNFPSETCPYLPIEILCMKLRMTEPHKSGITSNRLIMSGPVR